MLEQKIEIYKYFQGSAGVFKTGCQPITLLTLPPSFDRSSRLKNFDHYAVNFVWRLGLKHWQKRQLKKQLAVCSFF